MHIWFFIQKCIIQIKYFERREGWKKRKETMERRGLAEKRRLEMEKAFKTLILRKGRKEKEGEGKGKKYSPSLLSSIWGKGEKLHSLCHLSSISSSVCIYLYHLSFIREEEKCPEEREKEERERKRGVTWTFFLLLLPSLFLCNGWEEEREAGREKHCVCLCMHAGW